MLDEGPFNAALVINASGPWSKYLAATAGLDLDVRAVREQDAVWSVPTNWPMPECSFSTAIEAAYCRPLGDGRFILGLGYPKHYFDVDPYNFKKTMDDDFRFVAYEKNLKRAFLISQGAKFLEAYAALYDITPLTFIPSPARGLAWTATLIFAAVAGTDSKYCPRHQQKPQVTCNCSVNTTPDFAGLSYDRIAQGKLYGGLGGHPRTNPAAVGEGSTRTVDHRDAIGFKALLKSSKERQLPRHSAILALNFSVSNASADDRSWDKRGFISPTQTSRSLSEIEPGRRSSRNIRELSSRANVFAGTGTPCRRPRRTISPFK